MELKQDEFVAAINASLEITSPESTMPVPARLAPGLYHLRRLALALAQNKYAIVPVMAKEDPKKVPEPDPEPEDA